MIPCICIDDTNRPKEIPVSKWVKKDTEYTITNVYWMEKQKFKGVDLSEIELDDSNLPYNCFALKRFAIPLENLKDFVALCEASTFMNDVAIEDMVKELTEKIQEKELV